MKTTKKKNYSISTKNKKTREEILARRKEVAIAAHTARKKKDMKTFNILRNVKKLSAYELGVFKDACEEYETKLKAFKAGVVVKGKGKDKTTLVVPHSPEPSFNKIYKKYAKAAGLYKKA